METKVDIRRATEHFIALESPAIKHGGKQYTVSWHDVNLKVKATNSKTKKLEEKIILNNVSGFAASGELLAIMGPSGAGKSSLLDVISSRNKNITGHVLVNGVPWTRKLSRQSSYVMQDDLFYGTITVKEHLMFQARLKMGRTHTHEQCCIRVTEVMEELGLSKCRDTMIGNERIRGISGGEKKRLSFATEILTNPSILFVDEPTSGLDSYMAETVVLQLQQLARGGRTVIATIHQPSSDIVGLFDSLYLLCEGSPVYHGKFMDAVPYFASIGYQCPQFMNPCDFFMRQLVVVDRNTDTAGMRRLDTIKNAWVSFEMKPTMESDSRVTTQVSLSIDEVEMPFDTRLSIAGQLQVLAKRNVLRYVRDKILFWANIFMAFFVATLVGLIFRESEVSQSGVQNFAGAFFFINVNALFSSANPNFISVPLEIPIVLREYEGGLYNLLSWYVAKSVSELPMQIIAPVCFFIPVYLIIGIGHGFQLFLEMQTHIILVYSSGVGLAYMVACMVRRTDLAPLVGIIFIMPFLLLGGLLVNSDNIPVYFVWIQYISPIKYGFEGIMKIFWSQVDTVPCVEQPCLAGSGNDVLKYFAIDIQNQTAMYDKVMLVTVNIAFRIAAFVILWLNVGQRRNLSKKTES